LQRSFSSDRSREGERNGRGREGGREGDQKEAKWGLERERG